jgi:hypothetical protein
MQLQGKIIERHKTSTKIHQRFEIMKLCTRKNHQRNEISRKIDERYEIIRKMTKNIKSKNNLDEKPSKVDNIDFRSKVKGRLIWCCIFGFLKKYQPTRLLRNVNNF